mmetsp:Transcript_79797/g.97688  ORF Transcript_79797/g.97688 Transcript_79797/m.97688 type:complete len:340 (-) Transcript_79797:26-1045(-)
MGNSFWQSCCQSCCHPHAKLNRLDKLVNFLLGISLKLEKVTPNDKKALEQSRRAIERSNAGYEKVVDEIWQVEEKTFERLSGSGGPVKVLFHRPRGCDRKSLPLVLWVHGGGMVLGSYRDLWGLRFLKLAQGRHGPICFASIQYRFAPEFKFPAAVDDFVSAYRSLNDDRMAKSLGYCTSKISVAGVSAGCLVACHGLLRLERWLPAALLYPMVDPTMSSESHQLFGTLPSCPSKFLRTSWDWLLSDGDGNVREDLKKDANLLESDFSVLGKFNNKILVATASCDCLRDEGRELAKKLAEAGADVTALEGHGSHCLPHLLDSDFRDKIYENYLRNILPG